MHMSEEYWEDVQQALAEVHNSGLISEWLGDKEVFLKDHMDFARASYETGYYDAMDDAREALADLERKLMTDED